MNSIAIQQQLSDKSSYKTASRLYFAETESIQGIAVLFNHLHFNLRQTTSTSIPAVTRGRRGDFHPSQHTIVTRQLLARKHPMTLNIAANLPPSVNTRTKSNKEE